MACPLHPYHTKSLRALGAETKAQEEAAKRVPFFGPMSRKATEARQRLTAAVVEEVRQNRIMQRMPLLVGQTIQRNDGIITDLLRDIYRTVGRRFVVDGFDQAEQKATEPEKESLLDAWFTRVDQWLDTPEAGREIRRITDTQRRDIIDAINEGLEEGLGTEEVAQLIDDRMEDIDQQRGRTIARTETITASNMSSQEGARQSNTNRLKQWFDSDDGRVRGSHEIIGASDPIPLNQEYEWTSPEEGVVTARFPGDPNLPAAERINCRCVELYVEPNE